MRIYLAGKTAGDPGYREKFQKAQARLERDGVTVLNPPKEPAAPPTPEPAEDPKPKAPVHTQTPEPPMEKAEPKPPEPPGEIRPWSGFVHIRCDHCHKESTVCLRTPTRQYMCRECGNSMDLPDSTTAYINCECGFNGRYITNVADWFFDIPCAQCGRPNTVKYLPGKNIYVPIDQAPKRRKPKAKK